MAVTQPGFLRGEPNSIVVENVDPGKVQVSSGMTSDKVFEKGTGGDVNITGWTAIRVCPTTASCFYYNDDSTKLQALPANVVTTIWVNRSNITKVTIKFGTAIAANSVAGF